MVPSHRDWGSEANVKGLNSVQCNLRYAAMLNAWFESAEVMIVAGTVCLEGGVLASDSVCKNFEAPIISTCGSSSISDINLFHAQDYVKPRQTRRLRLQGASKLDCTPILSE